MGKGRSQRYEKLAPVVARLAEALARDGRFAAEDKILDVAIALERMYELGGGEISHKMRTQSSWFLGRDAEDRVRVMESVAEFYRVRSEIVHNREAKGIGGEIPGVVRHGGSTSRQGRCSSC